MGSRRKRGAVDGEEPREGTTSVPRPLADGGAREARPHVEARLDRQAGRWVLLSLLAVILVTPVWMLLDDLGCFALLGDDFAYIADSRQWPVTWRHLLTPHNTHIVPIFRIWTFGLVALAGHLVNLPMVFAAASYLGLVMAMLAVGWLTALETRRPALGLTAMAVLGISTVTHPLVTWYSAGQALWAGTGAVATILLAREWSLKGGRWRLGLVALGALAAPAIWTGGLVAGPAATAYLWAKDRSRSRTPAAILAGVTISWILFLLILSRRQISEPKIIWERHRELWPRPIQAVLHTAQAIIEALVLGNLGLDSITTPGQALALTLALVALWAWSRRGRGRANPLETSGVTVLLGSFLLIYTFRGNLPYSSVRALGWYHALGQVGAILFGAGWWSALHPAGVARLTLRQALGVLGLVLVLCLVHVPRAERALLAGAPRMTPSEARKFPITELQRLRALHFKIEHHDRQLRALARLDRLDHIAQEMGAGPETLRRIFGRIIIPGIPANQEGTDVFSLLTPLPADAKVSPDLSSHRAEIDNLLLPEPQPRPPWLDPAEDWPRKPEADSIK